MHTEAAVYYYYYYDFGEAKLNVFVWKKMSTKIETRPKKGSSLLCNSLHTMHRIESLKFQK